MDPIEITLILLFVGVLSFTMSVFMYGICVCVCVSIYNISVIIWNRPFHLPKFVEFLVVCFTSYFILFSFSIYLLWFFHMKYCAIHLFRVDALKNWYTTCVLSTSHYLFLYIKQLRDFIICFSLVQLWNCLLFLVHNE